MYSTCSCWLGDSFCPGCSCHRKDSCYLWVPQMQLVWRQLRWHNCNQEYMQLLHWKQQLPGKPLLLGIKLLAEEQLLTLLQLLPGVQQLTGCCCPDQSYWLEYEDIRVPWICTRRYKSRPPALFTRVLTSDRYLLSVDRGQQTAPILLPQPARPRPPPRRECRRWGGGGSARAKKPPAKSEWLGALLVGSTRAVLTRGAVCICPCRAVKTEGCQVNMTRRRFTPWWHICNAC